MDVLSRCPLRVASMVWQQKPGAFTLTVVCKATFRIAPGEAELAPHQEEPATEEHFREHDPDRSLIAPRDVVPFKHRVDVVLVGSAHAPRKEPVSFLIVRLALGRINKSIAVHADRHLTPAGLVREVNPFVRMPLRYERTAWSPDNPVGMRIEPQNDGKPVMLPNLAPLGFQMSPRGGSIPTIGFGPIAPTWPARADLLAKTSPAWTPERWEKMPVPAGFDPAFFNVAPPDQRLDILQPNEAILLENMHPEHPRLTMHLPGLVPRATVERNGKAPTTIDFTADTVWIDVDQARITVTYRGYVALESPTEPGRVVIEVARAPRRPTQPDMASDYDPAGTVRLEITDDGIVEAESDRTAHINPSAQPGPSLPFVAPSPNAAPMPQSAPRPAPPRQASVDPTATMDLRGVVFPKPSTPFVMPASSSPAMVPALPPIVSSVPQALQAPEVRPVPMTMGQVAMLSATPSPGPNEPDARPLAIPISEPTKVPGRVVVKARSSSSASDADPPRIASLEELKNLPKPKCAAPESAARASDAAVGPSENQKVASTGQKESPATDARKTPSTAVELLWFDPNAIDAIRAEPAWKEVIGKLKPRPRDADSREGAPPAKAKEAKDQREVRGLLAQGTALSPEELRGAMADAIDEAGTFVPPLVLLQGELVFPFDEFETLKATLAAATPLATADKKLKETVDAVTELLRTPWLQGAAGIADGLTAQIKAAFAEGRRGLPSGYLEMHTERMLLERRQYQKRTVLKQQWIRSLLALPGSSEPIPTYIPANLAQELPAFQCFRGRLIAECHAQVDQLETSPIALKTIALGREIVPMGRR